MNASPKRRSPTRSGRLPRELAAKVDERILDAAEQVFLKRGFEGAAIDEVAEVARAGKTTIYSRYAGKKDLFAAVALRHVSNMMQIAESSPQGATMEARLQTLASNILRRALSHETVALCRVTLSEAERFPDIATQVSYLARERGVEEVARLLGELDGAAQADGDVGPSRRTGDARIFMDLIVLPMILRRLFGESLGTLQAEISDHVADRVGFFLAASKRRRAAAVEA